MGAACIVDGWLVCQLSNFPIGWLVGWLVDWIGDECMTALELGLPSAMATALTLGKMPGATFRGRSCTTGLELH
jgi:hypothetical protein